MGDAGGVSYLISSLMLVMFLSINMTTLAQTDCVRLSPKLCEVDHIYQLQWSPDGSWFAVLGRQEDDIAFTVDIYQTVTGHQVVSHLLPVMDQQPYTFLWSPDSEKLLIIGDHLRGKNTYNHWLTVIDVNTTGIEIQLEEPYFLGAAVWSPDSRSIALWNEFDVKMLQLNNGVFTTVGNLEQTPLKLTFSPDGQLLVALLEDRTVRVWEAPTS